MEIEAFRLQTTLTPEQQAIRRSIQGEGLPRKPPKEGFTASVWTQLVKELRTIPSSAYELLQAASKEGQTGCSLPGGAFNFDWD